jgi:uncharacterized protein (DUF2235 family)
MKRIVLCADGTWSIRDQVDKATGKRRPTNVTKVARAIRPRDRHGTDQVVFYHVGVGTRPGVDRYTGGAFGDGIEDNIRELYRFLVYNHEPDDEIFLFGFSRGAFTVRTLAGFMNFVGLIEKEGDYWIPEIYESYERSEGPGTKGWTKAFRGVRQIRPCPPIKFIGVWDTVGALGAPGILGQLFRPTKYKYHDVGLNPHIQNAFQALAIDERRKPFMPNLWTRPASWTGALEQAWFPGAHANVGGSFTPDGLANEALHWIVEKAEGLGLELDNAFLAHYRPCYNSKLHDSMTGIYRFTGEYIRPIGRHLSDGEGVHQSALDRLALASLGYAPANLRRAVAKTYNTTRIARGVPCPDD